MFISIAMKSLAKTQRNPTVKPREQLNNKCNNSAFVDVSVGNIKTSEANKITSLKAYSCPIYLP